MVFQVNDALALVKLSKETKGSNALFEVMSFLFIILFWLNLLFEYSKLWFSNIWEPGWNTSAVDIFLDEMHCSFL